MIIRVVLIAVLFAILVSCIGAINLAIATPSITTTKTQIKVGESIVLLTTKPGRFRESYPEIGFDSVTKAFLYSPNPTTPELGPYVPEQSDLGGFLPTTIPSLFPITANIEVTTPITPITNVPPLIDALNESGQARGYFTIIGKSVGITILKTAFLTTTLQHPNAYTRYPNNPKRDGEIVIEVIP